MLSLRVVGVFLIGICAAFASSAQTNPLLGQWRTTSHDPASNVDALVVIVFRADGTYRHSVMAPPKRDGSGAGILVTDGDYRVTGTKVGFRPRAMNACDTSGAQCLPYPVNASPGEFVFEMEGPNRYRAGGSEYYRMQ